MTPNNNYRQNPHRQQQRPPQRPPQRRRRKKKASFARVIITIVVVAIIAAVLIVAGIYFAGVRYMRVNVTDSLYVKFLGQVDDNGQPYKGRIIYSDGISAEVNLDRDEISYSNGDVYCGPLDNLLKNGEGEMRYANGDT